MKTTQVNDVVGNFVVKLRDVKTEKLFLDKQLPLSDNDNNFNEKLNDNNYTRTVKKLHNVGLEI